MIFILGEGLVWLHLKCCVSKTLYALSPFVMLWRKIGVGARPHLFCLNVDSYWLFLGDCRIVLLSYFPTIFCRRTHSGSQKGGQNEDKVPESQLYFLLRGSLFIYAFCLLDFYEFLSE